MTRSPHKILTVLALILCLSKSSPALYAEPETATSPSPQRILIGSKSFTESVIVGEIIAAQLKQTGFAVSHRQELGGSQILWKALQSGEIDLYPEYSGTLVHELLAEDQADTPEKITEALARRGVAMTGHLGFNNTYALGMQADKARSLGIRTLSDLSQHISRQPLKFGLSDEFLERQDGWPGLQRHYHFPDLATRGLDHSLAYRAIGSGTVDVTDLYTTDAEIKHYQLIALEDDLHYFPEYQAIILYRMDLVERAPTAVSAIRQLEGQISTGQMTAMNAAVKIERQPETTVAVNFLRQELGLSIGHDPSTERSVWELRGRQLLRRTGEHLFLVVTSLSLAIIIAIPMGIWAYYSPRAAKMILAVAGVIQTIPSLAVLVFMIPFLGLGAFPAIAALFLYSLLPMIRGTYIGLVQIPDNLKEAATVLGLSPLAKLRRVELPLASPSILSGIKTAAVINVGTATIGALIGAGGYGQPILTGIRLDNVSLILQGAIPAAVLAIAVQSGFDYLERWVIPAGLRSGRTK